MAKKHIFAIVILAIVLAPIYKLVTQMKVFTKIQTHNDEKCEILNYTSHFIGVEDITKVFEDANSADFIGGYEPRLQSWMNHSFVHSRPSSLKRGFVHIHVDKSKCRKEKQNKNSNKGSASLRDCVTLNEVESIALKDSSLLFNPHGIWYDETKGQLLVISHGWNFGGDRVEVFDVARVATNNQGKETVDLRTKHSHSIVHAPGYFPSEAQQEAPFNFALPLSSGVAPTSSAYGVYNDLAIDRVNNRLIITQWKPYPSPHYFPDARKWQDKHAQLLVAVVGDPTFIMTCPMVTSTPEEPDVNQCIRSRQRFALANGVIANQAGNMLIVADLAHFQLAFLTPRKIDKESFQDAHTFDPFVLLGKFTSKVAGDNLDLQKENSTHICITSGGHQRLVDPAVYFERDRSVPLPGAVTNICCKKSPSTGFVDAPASDCQEEILYLSDAIDKKKHLSGVSVGNLVNIDDDGDDKDRLLIMGSYFHPGVGVCWI